MATLPIAPRDDDEGSIGKPNKRFTEGHFVNGYIYGNISDGITIVTMNSVLSTIDNLADLTATALELNLLDLSGLTAGWVLSADSATTASWKAPSGGGGGGDVATDTIWDAIGDLAVGSGANIASKLTIGSALQVLRVNAGATGLEWATDSNGVQSLSVGNSTFINLFNIGTASDPNLTPSLSATGVPSATTFLRGDNTWATPLPGTGDLVSTNNLSDVTNPVTSLSNLGGQPLITQNTAFNKDFGTTVGTVLEGNTTTITGTQSSNITTNNSKVTNATHTGDVTGDTALTIAVGAVDIPMLSATGTTDATTFLRGDNTWATPAGASGGPSLRNVSATDTFAAENETINCQSGTFIVNLPTAIGIIGTTYTLINSGAGVITLTPAVGEFINGSATIDLATQYTSRTVQSDGTDWIII
jgi:hypothetical protein